MPLNCMPPPKIPAQVIPAQVIPAQVIPAQVIPHHALRSTKLPLVVRVLVLRCLGISRGLDQQSYPGTSRQLGQTNLLSACLILCCCSQFWTGAASSGLAEEPIVGTHVDYLKDIKPLLESKCYACHGVLKQEGGLRLETFELMSSGGDSGPAVVPGHIASLLLERVGGDADSRMPPADEGAALTTSQIDVLRRWIAEGAPAPDETIPASPQMHWAFQPITLPNFKNGIPPSIDNLLEAKQAELGLSPQALADQGLRIRRLYLDLIGLPPTLDQLHDTRPWVEIVDELLASPQHGERWGRHWMDVWRYSDWYGLGPQLRNSQRHMWHWRDWIVDSLNADKGYDRMIHEMLAGDELAPHDPAVVAGTGFLARNYYLFNRTTWLDSTIEHTGKAFLGLTLNCAKCHDHKYDPLSQVDYYNFRAIFEPHQVRLDPLPGQIDLETDGLPRVFDDHLDAPTFLHIKGDAEKPDDSVAIVARVPELFAHFQPTMEIFELPPEAYAMATRDYVQRDHLQAAASRLSEAVRQLDLTQQILQQALAAEVAPSPAPAGLEQADNAETTVADAATEDPAFAVRSAEASLELARADQATLQAVIDADCARYDGGSPSEIAELATQASQLEKMAAVARAKLELVSAGDDQEKIKVAQANLESAKNQLHPDKQLPVEYASLRATQKALETPAHTEADYSAVYPSSSTGRRLALARWITARENPLAARVAVNHVWMRHFGEPLVESVFDFGLRAQRPTHADLLDYLAIELIESGWSLKHLHRLIVNSVAYQRSSSSASAAAENLTQDPGNKYYWRMNAGRMESQVVRDSLLLLSGKLDLTLGGPSLDVGPNSRRRSIYFKHSRDDQDKFLSMFDDADLLQCYRRSQSIVPQQALALSNSQLALSMSQEIAERMNGAMPTASMPEFVAEVFECLLGRAASEAEVTLCVAFTERLREQLAAEDSQSTALESRIRRRLIHSLINHNDFVTIR